jgi:hypothetical protein
MCWIAVSSSHDRRFVMVLEPGATRSHEAPDAPSRRGISHVLRLAVSRAAALGGSIEAAAMYTDWREPVVVASPPGGRSRWMRMWSMSKAVAMVGLLRAEGWGQVRGNVLSPEVVSALQGAIARSENCRQRRIVLELQHATGGPAGARRAVAEVLHAAGGRVRPSDEVEPPESSCVEYLESQREIADPLATGALLGTSEWRIGDAIRFVRALGAGLYGGAVTKRALDEMRIPKAVSREVAPSELTAPLGWGAGRAFAGLHPAYKAGWGGSLDGDFMAGQIALVDLPAGRLAVAVMFHPDVQPPSDDPGRTAAPHAIELVMGALR